MIALEQSLRPPLMKKKKKIATIALTKLLSGAVAAFKNPVFLIKSQKLFLEFENQLL